MNYNYCRIFILLAIFFSCGKENDPASPLEGKLSESERVLAQFYATTAKQEFLCDSNHCPDYLIKVFSRESSKNKFECHGVFIGEDIVLTSRQCVHPDLSKNNQLCNLDMFFVGNNKEKGQFYGCSRVLDLSRVFNQPERSFFEKHHYAVFRTSTKYLGSLPKISIQGIDHNENLIIHHFETREQKSVMLQKNCRSQLQSVLDPYASNSKAPLIPLVGSECSLADSIKGAPVLNKKNQLVGLISGQHSNPLLNDFLANYPTRLGQLDYLSTTNLACVDYFYKQSKDIPFQCRVNKSEEELASLMKVRVELNPRSYAQLTSAPLKNIRAIVNQINQNSPLNPLLFQLRTGESGEDFIDFHIKPKCFKDPQAWLQNPPRRFLRCRFLICDLKDEMIGPLAVRNFPHQWRVKVDIDQYYQPFGYIDQEFTNNYRYEFNPYRLNYSDQTRLNTYIGLGEREVIENFFSCSLF